MLCPAAGLTQDLPCPTAPATSLGIGLEGLGWSQEAVRPEAVGSTAKFCLPPLSLWPTFPTPSHNANTE